MHYCVAAALLDGQVGLSTFTQEKIDDPRIRALIPRIAMEVDEDLRQDSEFATRIVVETESGKRFERFVPLAMGKPARWFSVERMQSKFRDCARPVLGASGCDDAFTALYGLDTSQHVAGIAATLLPPA
jgi:2-methylcitrate dehydratase PrpD